MIRAAIPIATNPEARPVCPQTTYPCHGTMKYDTEAGSKSHKKANANNKMNGYDTTVTKRSEFQRGERSPKRNANHGIKRAVNSANSVATRGTVSDDCKRLKD